jgi:hypothetical protein
MPRSAARRRKTGEAAEKPADLRHCVWPGGGQPREDTRRTAWGREDHHRRVGGKGYCLKQDIEILAVRLATAVAWILANDTVTTPSRHRGEASQTKINQHDSVDLPANSRSQAMCADMIIR